MNAGNGAASLVYTDKEKWEKNAGGEAFEQ
jgi:hypothetical protein